MDPNDPLKKIEDATLELEQKKQSLESETEVRNLFQLERDKINAFWEISKRELEEIQAEVRNKERELEEQGERHQVELKVYKQKIRHLLYEQKITIDRLKIESENALKLQADEFRQKQYQLKEDIRALKQDVKSYEISHDETLKAMRLAQDVLITQLREQFEDRIKEIQVKYQTRMNNLREELEAQAKEDAEEVEKKKNVHVKELMKKHEQAFQDIKDYYTIITTNNHVLIKTLKDDVAGMKKNEATNEKLMFEIASENKRLSEPLSNALAEIAHLRKEVANHERDKVSLKNAKTRLTQLEGQLKSLKWEHEIMESNFKQVQTERDDLYTNFEQVLRETQQKTLLQNQLLETKVVALQDLLEKKDAQVREVLKASKLADESSQLAQQAKDVLVEKDIRMNALQEQENELKHNFLDFFTKAMQKMSQYGIPVDDVAFDVPKILAVAHS